MASTSCVLPSAKTGIRTQPPLRKGAIDRIGQPPFLRRARETFGQRPVAARRLDDQHIDARFGKDRALA